MSVHYTLSGLRSPNCFSTTNVAIGLIVSTKESTFATISCPIIFVLFMCIPVSPSPHRLAVLSSIFGAVAVSHFYDVKVGVQNLAKSNDLNFLVEIINESFIVEQKCKVMGIKNTK